MQRPSTIHAIITVMPAHLVAVLMATVLLLWAFLRIALGASPALDLFVRPGPFASAPATLHVEVRLVPHASDRVLSVVMDSGDYYRASLESLVGEQSPRLYSWRWRDVPAGVYKVIAAVGDGRVWRAQDRESVTLVGN